MIKACNPSLSLNRHMFFRIFLGNSILKNASLLRPTVPRGAVRSPRSADFAKTRHLFRFPLKLRDYLGIYSWTLQIHDAVVSIRKASYLINYGIHSHTYDVLRLQSATQKSSEFTMYFVYEGKSEFWALKAVIPAVFQMPRVFFSFRHF